MANDGFCPKCGAVMYNGVCASCGYGKAKAHGSSTEKISNQAETGGRFSSNAERYVVKEYEVKNTSTWKGPNIGIVLMVGFFVFVILALAFTGAMFSQVMNKVTDFGVSIEAEPLPDDYYDYNEEDYIYEEEYIPTPSDDYLEAIVSSTVRGLSYDIAWNDTYLYTDDENNEAVFYCYYPLVIGSDADYIADINALISQTAMSFIPDTLDDDDYGYLDGYVTYMSEEILSVAMLYYREHAGNEDYHISTLNFDMTTGEQITIQKMIPDFEFISDLRDNCEEQNGDYSAMVLESMSDDDIMKAIINPETGAAFYSPVGLDIGFNYPDGWMTVTLKYEIY